MLEIVNAVVSKGSSQPRFRRWMVLIGPSFIFLAVFLIIPLGILLRSSFYVGSQPFNQAGFSFQQYKTFFSDLYYVGVLLETVIDGLLVSLVSLIIGFPVGYSLARLPQERRRWRLMFVILPLSLSLVVIIFGWMVILGRNGLVNGALISIGLISEPARLLFNRAIVLLVLLQQFLPFMILTIMSVISQIDPVLEQAAANLRANRFVTFRRVIFPMAMPGIISGMSLVFILTVSAFMTPRLIGGNRVQMLGSLIYEQVMIILNWPFGSAVAIILLAITLGLVTGVNFLIAWQVGGMRSVSRGN
jgi:putative spermidine/putrescine transport system permease protein